MFTLHSYDLIKRYDTEMADETAGPVDLAFLLMIFSKYQVPSKIVKTTNF